MTTPRPTRRGVVMALASPRLTVGFFVLMAAGALWVTHSDSNATVATVLPLSLLVLNLIAAIVTTPRFRADLPLLVFHVALLAFVTFLAVARLIYFDGATILTSGTAFEGNLVRDQRGPLHGNDFQTLRFANEGFTEHFPERGKFHTTYNRVRWWDKAGNAYLAEIGDDHPLVLDGYRIYTTGRRGFSPLFYWQPTNGSANYGTVQLPDHNSADLGPAISWQLPDGSQAWVMLKLGVPDNQLHAGRRSDLGAENIDHHLVLRIGERRMELRPGATVDLDGGRLTYVRLASWMGYRMVYDPTEPWLVATVLVAIGTLLWFYARIFRRPAKRVLFESGQ